ncbi:N-6 DNA Methylase [Turicibacter sp. HGF1]|uniref:HsdM family class I SAM-dependent methyltransferase n=1 Tax=Turicibacter sp. HGF1 TaxID=910310 RepID=UPI0001FD7FF9|nr:N-6 DNA methylase [Turicibacter sp. HGF1]EGC92680.1 N-6 DNA Methylase [Turicibacter sp. HGF1]
MSKLEKVTDLIVFNFLQLNGYVNATFEKMIEEVDVWAKKAVNKEIDDILKKSSKRKTGKGGYPEYIIYDRKSDLVIVIEDKKDTKFHMYEKSLLDKAEDYAVNGALWYAKNLKEKFDVIAIGVSGNDITDLKIDTYFWGRNAETFNNLNLHELKDIAGYREIVNQKEENQSGLNDVSKMNDQAKILNDFLRDYLGVIEHERLYVIGSILFALEDPIFKMTYSRYTGDGDLANAIWNCVDKKIKGSSLDNKEIIQNELKSTLLSLQDAQKEGIKEKYPKGALLELTKNVDNLLYDYHKHGELDIMSIFFTVFLSYSTSGGSDLGIVLTPAHITKLFCDLAAINLESKVLDICAGTGGFLTSAWKTIKLSDKYTEMQKEVFRQNNLYGVEKDKSIYTIIALNMFINKDGKSHIFKGDCFSLKKEISDFECNVGFINPPYSDSIYSELSFVELMLDSLLPESIGIAILPVNAISSRTKKHSDILSVKQSILSKHTLVASIQMPPLLFYPKGTETVVLVFKTGAAHTGDTWFAKFDDGYELIKHQKTRTPRLDADEQYRQLLDAYCKKSETDFSFNKHVTYTQQWVYTMFEDANYEISDSDLQDTLNDYIAYLIKNRYL